MTVNATSAVALGIANGWKISKTSVEEVKRSRGGNHQRWSHVKADTDSFDAATHIVTFSRGDATITMPVTPDAGLYSGLPTMTVKEYDAAERYRYVRGALNIGIMSSSESDGKPILLSDLERIVTGDAGKRAAKKPTAKKTPNKRATAKKPAAKNAAKKSA
jgi:hypothetical protein